MKNIQRMIEERGGYEAVRENYLRLENPPFMRLVVEVIGGPYENGGYEVSVAHYGEQNGDAMRDPEMTFLVVPAEQGTTWTPLTFEDSYMGAWQVAATVTPEGRLNVRDSQLQRDLRVFANQWDQNLMEQGFGRA
jgi:hypothetical protein